MNEDSQGVIVPLRYVFDFSQGSGDQKDLLGGKGAGLAEMTRLGLPVPPGFTVSTRACREYLETREFPEGMWEQILQGLERLESGVARRFGGYGTTPLLVSVRSGAKFSMPGMMDTILNLGINDEIVKALGDWAQDEGFAWDAYRRFVQTYGKVVLRVPGGEFEAVLSDLRTRRGVAFDSDLTAEDLEEATRRFQEAVERYARRPIPTDPIEQLEAAIRAVFGSWDNRRARDYRRIHGIADDLGTAANVQAMVFGDLGDDSGTGVCFTRDPSTGERVPYGEYLPNAQGEDVVAGIRTPMSLAELHDRHPEVHEELIGHMDELERDYRDMCDIEFTVERGHLWVLQTRVGKRTATAAVRMAVEMMNEGLITEEEAILRVDPESLDQLLHPRLPARLDVAPLAAGVDASPGAATGVAVFDADSAVEWAAEGKRVILVRWETTPDDIHGMVAAVGILTSHGGKTSHAAVVARGMGTPAVTGVEALDVDEEAGRFRVGDQTVEAGDTITIDGTTGTVFIGELPLVQPEPTPELHVLLGWADRHRRLGVWANADLPADAVRAREWGAEGIGLARTEHMFLGERLPVVRSLILTDQESVRNEALEQLLQMQVSDFEGLLEAMDGLPVIVRLLDPPLHEFLPDRWDLERERVERIEAEKPTDEIDELMAAVARWEEANPMLGFRGVRLGLLKPEIYVMQVQAALEAVRRRVAAGGDPRLEIMVPLVAHHGELRRVRRMIEAEMGSIRITGHDLPDIPIGTMIELPRAALTAGEIAEVADFFSFGTNDLTQTTFGVSRDDAEGRFLGAYVDEGVLDANPFGTLDEAGVGELVAIGTERGRATNPNLSVGICGEHGGDPASIDFCHRTGLDYVSCSPPRVAAARLAAAQAALGERGGRASL